MSYQQIFQAVQEGDVRKVTSMIDSDASAIDISDHNSTTPLTRAFAFKRLDLAQFLIERGANLLAMNHSDRWGMRCLGAKHEADLIG